MPARKKPADERTGKQKYAGQDPQFVEVSKGTSRNKGIPIPKASPKWHPAAQSWFRSLALSGQSEFYEASDWATAVACAQAYDAFLRTRNASLLGQFTRLSERLGATIIDRKRARIELVDADLADLDEDAADAAILRWQGRLRAVPDAEAATGDDSR
jgi:hypothetical protein